MKTRRFGRGTNQRKALFRSLANSLILYEKVVTTEPKAKEVRPIVEKLITKARTGTIHSRRLVEAALANPNATRKMFDLIGPQFKDRAGGYLRVTKIEARSGDAAPMAKLEFVEEIVVPSKEKKLEKKEIKVTKTRSKATAKKDLIKKNAKK